MNIDQFIAGTGCGHAAANKYFPVFEQEMPVYGINTEKRIAAFLAQVGHESESLVYATELYGPTPQQKKYERDFTAAWPPTADDQTNRLAFQLGNIQMGDGSKFRGHGLIQTTGRYNHKIVGIHLGQDFESNPALLAELPWSVASACFFFKDKGLNILADTDNFVGITKVINGGLNGWDDRYARWRVAREAFGVKSSPV